MASELYGGNLKEEEGVVRDELEALEESSSSGELEGLWRGRRSLDRVLARVCCLDRGGFLVESMEERERWLVNYVNFLLSLYVERGFLSLLRRIEKALRGEGN